VGKQVAAGTHSVGISSRVVTVASITPDGLTAVCTDRNGVEVRVPMLNQRAKGQLPAVGETWILAQDHGQWMFSLFVASSSADLTTGKYTSLETGTLQVDSTSAFTGLATFNGGMSIPGTLALSTLTLSTLATFTGEADFNGPFKINGHPFSYYSAEYPPGLPFTSVATDVSPNPDTYLTILLPANAIMRFECFIIYSGGASGATNFRWNFSIPLLAEMDWFVPVYLNAANSPVYSETGDTAPTKVAWTTGVSTQQGLLCLGTLYMGNTAGNVTLNWAQGTSSSTTTRVWSGSRMTFTQVG